MPTIKLTQPAVDRLKPPTTGRVEHWDNQLPGFGLRISSTGRKSWIVMYRVSGKLVRETLGSVAVMPKVADARVRARASLQTAARGINPVIERRESALEAQSAKARVRLTTFGAVADRYVREYVETHTKASTIKETKRILDRDVKPLWAERAIWDINRQDVNSVLDAIADRGALVQANQTLVRLRTLFRWAVDEELITADPTARVRKRVKETARDRVLTDDEIRYFWAGCDRLGWPFGPMYKLLLLTAQRRDEVGGIEWVELDLETRTWTIPKEKAKNGRAHEVHLSNIVMEIIQGLPQIGGEPRFALTTNGERPVSGFSKSKARLDTFMLDQLRAEIAEARNGAAAKAEIDPWILHDLRRTSTTGMAKLNIAPHIVDRILNHVSGTIRGVAAVYNRHAYIEERKAALDAWSRYVESLVRPGPQNVVQLAAAR